MRLLQRLHKTAHLLHRSTVPGAMKMLADAGLTATPTADGTQLIDGRFEFYPTIQYWRSRDGKRLGYGVQSLIAAAKA